MNATDTRSFGPYKILTAAASYANGRERGMAHTSRLPARAPVPYVDNGTSYDPDWTAMCAASRENQAEWMRGYSDGKAARTVVA